MSRRAPQRAPWLVPLKGSYPPTFTAFWPRSVAISGSCATCKTRDEERHARLPTAWLHGFTTLFRLRHMPHSGLSSTQGDEASASAGGLPSDPEEFLLQEAEDNGSVPASPILLLARFPSECRPPNAPLMPRAVLPLHVVRSGHRTRGHAAKARPLPAVEYPPGKGDGYYGSSHLTGQHAALQTPLFVSLPTALARNRTSARRMS